MSMVCKATVRATWFRPEHRCNFTAKPNGYCARHDPDRLIKTLQAKVIRLRAELDRFEKILAEKTK